MSPAVERARDHQLPTMIVGGVAVDAKAAQPPLAVVTHRYERINGVPRYTVSVRDLAPGELVDLAPGELVELFGR